MLYVIFLNRQFCKPSKIKHCVNPSKITPPEQKQMRLCHIMYEYLQCAAELRIRHRACLSTCSLLIFLDIDQTLVKV